MIKLQPLLPNLAHMYAYKLYFCDEFVILSSE